MSNAQQSAGRSVRITGLIPPISRRTNAYTILNAGLLQRKVASIKAVSDVSKGRFVVMHTNAPQLAQNAIEKLEARFGGVRPRMIESLEAGPAIAVHAGPGAVGIFTAQDE